MLNAYLSIGLYMLHECTGLGIQLASRTSSDTALSLLTDRQSVMFRHLLHSCGLVRLLWHYSWPTASLVGLVRNYCLFVSLLLLQHWRQTQWLRSPIFSYAYNLI